LVWPFQRSDFSLEERLIDTEKLAQVENAIGLHEVEPIIPEATRRFRRRNLVCGEFSLADLRRADFTDADMRGARLIGALLDGATLSGTRLENATLYGTKLTGAKLEATALQGADLRFAHLNGARINFAKLQGANLDKARLGGTQLLSVKLQGANLTNAHLEGAFLWDAQLQGSNLSEARLQGALLIHPELQGANLSGARLQGAIVSEGQLQGANLSKAQLGGTGLFGAQLQGALLDESSLTLTAILRSSVWRATGAKCDDAYVHEPKLEPLFEESETITSGIERFIEQVVRDTPQETKQKVQITLRERLILDTNDDRTNEQLWRACQAKASTDDYDIRHAGYLADLVCNDAYYDVPWDINIGLDAQQRQYLARGIFAHWIRHLSLENAAAQAFARRVLGPDGQSCRGAREMGEEATQRLRKLMRNKLDP
jgi:uncharacterized protein YjbI with pentapeptide repeats